jgi:serine/threonine protein kinase
MESLTPEANPRQILKVPEKKTIPPPSPISRLPENIKNELAEFAHSENSDDIDKFTKQEPANDYEEILYSILQKLPKELINARLKEYAKNNTTLFDAIEQSLSFLQKRNMLWKYEGDEKYYQEIRESIQTFEGAKYQKDLFKGRGNAAFVFQVPEVPTVCIKFLHSPNMQRYSIEREFGILTTAHEISKKFETLKIPEPHAVAVHTEDQKSFFTMETIDGMTLLQLEQFPGDRRKFLERVGEAGFSESYLLSLLTDSKIQESMRRDIEMLHKHNVVHGDIHPRNIMLDINGNFYLIDFGNAVIPTNIATGIAYETIENTKETDLNSFKNSFEITSISIQKQANSTDGE